MVGERQRDAQGADDFVRTAHTFAVAGVVLGERDLTFLALGGEHHGGVEREEHRGGVADGRARAQVPAERGRVADQAGRELREELIEQGHPASQASFDLRQAQRGADFDVVVADVEGAQLVEAVHGQHERRADVADVDLHAEVGGACDQSDVRGLVQVVEEFVERGGAHEARGRRIDPGVARFRGGLLLTTPQQVRFLGLTQGVGGVADGAVAGAAAEVAAQGVQVKAVGSAFVSGGVFFALDLRAGFLAVGVIGRRAFGAVVLRGHRAHEAGGAVAALGAAAGGHFALHRMELAGAARSGCSAEAFGGDHFLPVEGDGGWQTRVDGGPAGAIIAVRPCDQHCTAPHSPSAQPSLAPVRPWSRRKSSKRVWGLTPAKPRSWPLMVKRISLMALNSS